MNKTSDKSTASQGPIRSEAILTTLVVVGFLVAYFHFFFDNHLKKGIEWTASTIHGAEVNVRQIQSRFLGGSFRLSGLEITNKEQPQLNLLSIEDIRFAWSWDALLRLKFVVNEAAVETIQMNSPRRRAGWVRPPTPPSGKPSLIEEVEKNALQQIQSQHSSSLLGDLAQLLGGMDEKELLKTIQDQLQAEKHIQKVKENLEQKEKYWRSRIDELPDKKEIEDIKKRSKELKFDSKDPAQFAKDLQEAKKLIKEADAKIDLIKKSGEDFKKDADQLKKDIAQIDDLIKKDIQNIESRLKIGNLDFDDLSKTIFSKMLADRLSPFQKYSAVAQQYMPAPKKEKSEQKIVPRPRGQGEDIRFPVVGGYPLFWLKKAIVSSKSTASGFSGDLRGELTHVSTDPQIIPEPLRFNLDGRFPHQEIEGVQLRLLVDHRTASPVQDLNVKVASYPLKNFNLAKDSSLRLSLTQAQASSQFQARLENQQFLVALNNQFTQLNYNIEAKSKIVDEALTAIFNGIPMIDLNARVAGQWSKFKVDIQSNLGRELGRGLEKYVKVKIDETKNKIRENIKNRIGSERTDIDKKYGELKDRFDKLLGDKKQTFEKERSELTPSSDKGQQLKNQLKEDLKNKGRDLLRRIRN